MKSFNEILKDKIDYYGKTEAAYEFAAEQYANELFESRMQDMYLKGYSSAIDSLRSSYEALIKRNIDKT